MLWSVASKAVPLFHINNTGPINFRLFIYMWVIVPRRTLVCSIQLYRTNMIGSKTWASFHLAHSWSFSHEISLFPSEQCSPLTGTFESHSVSNSKGKELVATEFQSLTFFLPAFSLLHGLKVPSGLRRSHYDFDFLLRRFPHFLQYLLYFRELSPLGYNYFPVLAHRFNFFHFFCC